MKAKVTKCAKCGGSYKMKSGGKVKRYQDAGNTENRTASEETTSSTPTKPMSKSEFKDAKKAVRQQNRLKNMSSNKLEKIGTMTGVAGGILGLVEGGKRLFSKNNKRGGTIKTKKVTSRPKKRK